LSSPLGRELLGARLAAHAGEFGDRERFLHACNIPRGRHGSRLHPHCCPRLFFNSRIPDMHERGQHHSWRTISVQPKLNLYHVPKALRMRGDSSANSENTPPRVWAARATVRPLSHWWSIAGRPKRKTTTARRMLQVAKRDEPDTAAKRCRAAEISIPPPA